MTPPLQDVPHLEYNSTRPQMLIPEYGRNVQKMIDYAVGLPERDHRNRVALSIIETIGNLNPHLRDNPDYRHKLWDHLFIMSNFQLDVDSPYPKPTPETFSGKPAQVPYPRKSAKLRYYGNILKDMIAKAKTMEPGAERDAFAMAIATTMKKSYLTWNKDTVDDATIWADLERLSDGVLPAQQKALADPGKNLIQVQQAPAKTWKHFKKGGKKKFKK